VRGAGAYLQEKDGAEAGRLQGGPAAAESASAKGYTGQGATTMPAADAAGPVRKGLTQEAVHIGMVVHLLSDASVRGAVVDKRGRKVRVDTSGDGAVASRTHMLSGADLGQWFSCQDLGTDFPDQILPDEIEVGMRVHVCGEPSQNGRVLQYKGKRLEVEMSGKALEVRWFLCHELELHTPIEVAGKFAVHKPSRRLGVVVRPTEPLSGE
jgi:hypothetical protein